MALPVTRAPLPGFTSSAMPVSVLAKSSLIVLPSMIGAASPETRIPMPRSGPRPLPADQRQGRWAGGLATPVSAARPAVGAASAAAGPGTAASDTGHYVSSPAHTAYAPLPVHDLAQARQRLAWYSVRWAIEAFHRMLKSGCRIEDRQLEDAQRLENCLAIDMVVARRILHLHHLSRVDPDQPCTVYFAPHEYEALYAVTQLSKPSPNILSRFVQAHARPASCNTPRSGFASSCRSCAQLPRQPLGVASGADGTVEIDRLLQAHRRYELAN